MTRFLSMFSDEQQIQNYLVDFLENHYYSTLFLLSTTTLEAKGILYYLQPMLDECRIEKSSWYDKLIYKQNVVYASTLTFVKNISYGNYLDGIIVFKPEIFVYNDLVKIFGMIYEI